MVVTFRWAHVVFAVLFDERLLVLQDNFLEPWIQLDRGVY